MYDSANRLTTRVKLGSPSVVTFYRYNGLGDRLQEGVYGGSTTTFTMDLNAGLTQVLSDGTNTYLYGVGRLAQMDAEGTEYFLTDGLGSVRQLVDGTGNITLGKNYDPYGTVAQSLGSGTSPFGYTGEGQDANGLVYLRARYFAPGMGRFLTKDTWMGDYNRPLSLNRWMYTEGNPVNYTDPTGLCGKPGEPPCPDWWQKDRTHLYVGEYGYFDTGHLRRGWTSAEWLVGEIEATLQRGGGVFQNPATSSEGEGTAAEVVYWVYYSISENLARKYKSKAMDRDEIFGIAYGIYNDFERGYENYQLHRVDRFPSVFSPEDFPSDHLGFWASIHKYDLDEIPLVLECLGEVKDLGNSGSLVVDVFPGGINAGYSFPRNYEFLPMISEMVNYGNGVTLQSRNVAWPKWLEIQPIPSGPYTWQKFIEGHK